MNYTNILRRTLIFIVVSFLGSCIELDRGDDSTTTQVNYALDSTEAEAEFYNVNSLYTNQTKPSMRLIAGKQLEYPGGNKRFPNGLKVEIYDEETGKLETTMVSDSAIYTSKTDVYTGMGNVEVIDIAQNRKMEGEIIFWNQTNGDVYSDQYIKITDNCSVTEGTGLKAKQDFSEYEILNPTGSSYVEGCD